MKCSQSTATLATHAPVLAPSAFSALRRRAGFLAWFTVAYNIVEGVISVWFGWEEGAASLVAFGLDSFIESASAVVVLWQLNRSSEGALHGNERPALLAIGSLFLLLAVATWGGSAMQLWQGGHPSSTLPGVIIACVSLSFMFALWNAKRKVGTQLGSQVLLKDAACSLACIQLSIVLLAGSLIYTLFPMLWWADAVAALILGSLIFKEGWGITASAWKGEAPECCP